MASATIRDIMLGVLDRRIGEAEARAATYMKDKRWQGVAYWKSAEEQLRETRNELAAIFPKNGC